MRVLRGKWSRSRIIAAVLAVLVIVFVVLTVVLFVKPDLNAPERVDAVVVLGGPNNNVPHEGVRLVEQGYAPTVAFSLAPGVPCVGAAVKQVDPAARTICFYAEPQSTQGEARSIKRLAAIHGWKRIIVVMPIPQASRARLRIGRCYSGQVLEVGVEPEGFWDWVRGIIYEWGAEFKALVLQPTC
jgi:hypothetical protein